MEIVAILKKRLVEIVLAIVFAIVAPYIIPFFEKIPSGQIMMVIVYWTLALFWFYIVTSILIFLKSGKTLLPHRAQLIKDQKQIIEALLGLAIILFIDSVYWALANTSRIGFINHKLSDILYQGWLISFIKILLLFAAYIFWTLLFSLLKSFGQINSNPAIEMTIDFTADAIGIMDEEGKIIYWNKGAENLFGFSRTFTKGKHIKDFMVPRERWNEIDFVIQRIRETKLPAQAYHSERKKEDGTIIPIDLTITPIVDDNTEKIIGFFGVMRPIVEVQPPKKQPRS